MMKQTARHRRPRLTKRRYGDAAEFNRLHGLEQLEDRRMLATLTIGDTVVLEGDSSPKFLDLFAGNSTAAQPIEPLGIAVSPVDAQIHVAGGEHDNILKLNSNTGQFEEFVKAGSTSLDNAYSIVFDDAGNVYVSSHNTDAILRFDPNGQFLGQFGPRVSSPTGLQFGPDGHFYIASATGGISRRNGTTGGIVDSTFSSFVRSRSGGLDRPERFVFGDDGNVYVASRGNSTIMRYAGPDADLPGEPLPSSGPGAIFVRSGEGGLDGPNGVAFGPDVNNNGHSDLFVSSANTDQVLVYDGSDGTYISEFISTAKNGLRTPSDLVFDSAHLIVGSLSTHEVLRFRDSTGALVSRLPQRPLADPRQPRGILLDTDDNLYITNGTTNDVKRYEAETGNFVDNFISDDGLRGPSGVVIGPDANVYVASFDTDSVRRYDAVTGSFMDEFVGPGAGGLNGPMDLEFRGSHLYVASFFTHEILRFDATTGIPDAAGAFVTAVSNGLVSPTHFTFNGNGELLVSSDGNDSVLRFDGSTGAPIDEFIATGLGGLDAPRGMQLVDGVLYVVSANSNEVLRYDGVDGTFLDVFAPVTSGLDFPIDLIADAGVFYVSSRDNDVVARFGRGSIAAFEVSLSEPQQTQVSVAFATRDGTASAGGDYTAASGEIVFEPGLTDRTIVVRTLDDAVIEPPPEETFSVTITNASGATIADETAIATIEDDDLPGMVTSFDVTSTGFVSEFSDELDASALNLGETKDGGFGQADVFVNGTTSGPVAGSLVVDKSLRKLSFIASGGPLMGDTYTVKLRSAEDGFKDAAGRLLDGDGNGVAGDDFTATFTVASSTAIEIGVPDFVRGPGQEVNIPADAAEGIPVSISDGAGVRSAVFAVEFDATLLHINDVTPGAKMPEGSTATVDTSMPGRAVINFNSPADLPEGLNTLVRLQAMVPAIRPSEVYQDQHVLDVNSIILSSGTGAELPAIGDDGLHLATFFSDVSGNGRTNALDASLVAGFAALLTTGFSATPLTDPLIVADISGNGRINAADASRVAQFSALIPVPEIPRIPPEPEPPLLLTSVSPSPNSHNAPTSTEIVATFDQDINSSTATSQSLVVNSRMRSGESVVVASGDTVTASASFDFFPGELVQVTLGSTLRSANGQIADPWIWEFRAEVNSGAGVFNDSGQRLSDNDSLGVSLGDLDNDGDLDAFVINQYHGNRVWLNDDGVFSDSGQILGEHYSRSVALGDLDADGDLDALVGAGNNVDPDRLWINNAGIFTDSGQILGYGTSTGVELGDLDGDGDLDAFVAKFGGNRVLVNTDGVLSDSGQELGDGNSHSVSLGDVDGDGDLDAFVANRGLRSQGGPNRVWLNDGGVFADSGQNLGDHFSRCVALGDLDGDGDLDAWVGGISGNRVWSNNGIGQFMSGDSLGGNSLAVALGDTDGDGDLDAVVGGQAGNQVWLNTHGLFTLGRVNNGAGSYSVALGDLDGDGDLDALVTEWYQSNRVWINENPVVPSVVQFALETMAIPLSLLVLGPEELSEKTATSPFAPPSRNELVSSPPSGINARFGHSGHNLVMANVDKEERPLLALEDAIDELLSALLD